MGDEMQLESSALFISRSGLVLSCLQTVSNLWSSFLIFFLVSQVTCHASPTCFSLLLCPQFPHLYLDGASKQPSVKQKTCFLQLCPCPVSPCSATGLFQHCACPDLSCMPVFPLPGCQEALHMPKAGEWLCSSTTGRVVMRKGTA